MDTGLVYSEMTTSYYACDGGGYMIIDYNNLHFVNLFYSFKS